ncbi:shikimate kinase [Persephonella sp.]
MKSIYLVGFMGSGKSTVGKLLAEKLGFRFVDIDQEIEKKEGKKIKDIFREKGESYFRDLEKRMIESFLESKNLVVSTGGGLGADSENMRKMKENGTVIWLDTPLETVLDRCKDDDERPLLKKDRYELEKLFEKRKDVYAQANIKVNTEGKSPEQIVNEILGRLR